LPAALILLLLASALSAQAHAQVPAAPPFLRPIDSVRIAENDTLLLSRPNRIVVGPRGHYFIADGGESRVLELAPSGAIVRTFGHRGRGPGEFQVPGFLALGGDSLLAVMESGQRRVIEFDLHTGNYKSSYSLIGWSPTFLVRGSTMVAGVLQPDSGTALVSLSSTGDRVGAEGVIPTIARTHPMLLGGFGGVTFTEMDQDVYAVFEVSQSLYHWKRGARVGDEVPIPAVRRKGVRQEMFEELLRDPSRAPSLAFDRSLPVLLAVMAPGALVLGTMDGEFDGKTFVGTYSVTVIDLERRRVCADLEVPAPRDPLPRIAVRGDTIVVVQQGIDSSGQQAAAIRRFQIRTVGCDWKPLPPAQPAGQ
jgi:hypothetical protein